MDERDIGATTVVDDPSTQVHSAGFSGVASWKTQLGVAVTEGTVMVGVECELVEELGKVVNVVELDVVDVDKDEDLVDVVVIT